MNNYTIIKNNSVCLIFMFGILTKCYLKTTLISNNKLEANVVAYIEHSGTNIFFFFNPNKPGVLFMGHRQTK